jgi:hypothetical protein
MHVIVENSQARIGDRTAVAIWLVFCISHSDADR